METAHVPVLAQEAVAALAIKPDGIYVDATFGRGGHSRMILERLGPTGRLIALDRDPDAIRAGAALQDGRLTLVQRTFSRLGQVLFAWVHLYDPHAPYEPPEPFLSRYAGQKYLGEIAYTDQVVGRLVSWLKGAEIWDRTMLVLLADHGESLGEHGENAHTFFVYDATQHVPLIVRTPWGDRGRSAAQVSTVDLMPTLLDLVGLAPQPEVDGRSLARLVLHPTAESPGVAYSETYFPRFHYGWQHLCSMRDGRWKLVHRGADARALRRAAGPGRDEERLQWPTRAARRTGACFSRSWRGAGSKPRPTRRRWPFCSETVCGSD